MCECVCECVSVCVSVCVRVEGGSTILQHRVLLGPIPKLQPWMQVWLHTSGSVYFAQHINSCNVHSKALVLFITN